MWRISGPPAQVSLSPLIAAVGGAIHILHTRGNESYVTGNAVAGVHALPQETALSNREVS